jgi:hypothetical protein
MAHHPSCSTPFFRIIAETLRELTEIRDAWRKLLDEIDGGVASNHTAVQQGAPVSGPVVGT